MNIKARLSRSNLNLNHKETPHFHRSYHNLNAIEQQFPPPPPRPAAEVAESTALFIQPQQRVINDPYFATQYATPAAQIYQQQNEWFRNNKSQWNKYNAYETPNFVPASFWMGAERFVYPTMKQDATAATWQPQYESQQQQHQPKQRGNILDYKNQSNTIYSVYNHNVKKPKPTIVRATGNGGTNEVATTIQPVIKVRTNVQGLPYTPEPERRNTVNEQRAIQAVMPLNDTLINKRQQTS